MPSRNNRTINVLWVIIQPRRVCTHPRTFTKNVEQGRVTLSYRNCSHIVLMCIQSVRASRPTTSNTNVVVASFEARAKKSEKLLRQGRTLELHREHTLRSMYALPGRYTSAPTSWGLPQLIGPTPQCFSCSQCPGFEQGTPYTPERR